MSDSRLAATPHRPGPPLARLAAALCVAGTIVAAPPLSAAPPAELAVGPGDVRIEQRPDGGYHLYVRAKPGLGSVLLTESTTDPTRKADTYAYRALEKNPINGEERRMLNGKLISPESRIYSLIDSSPEADELFGRAFHIFIPWVVGWGYPWTRNGSVYISDGTYLNVRTFAKPYADYAGAFADNPYLVRVVQKARPAAAAPAPASAAPPTPSQPTPAHDPASAAPPSPAPSPPTPPAPSALPPSPTPRSASRSVKPDLSRYLPETVRAFTAIAEPSGGETRFAANENDIARQIVELLDRFRGKSVDLVLCVDTTETMQNDIDAMQKMVPGMLRAALPVLASYRLGLVPYRDYFEEYLYRRYDFVDDLAAFDENLQTLRVAGGRDIPEAVYEALYGAIAEFPWAAERRLVILIGDAPPHPIPRGRVDGASVREEGARLGIEVDAIILPK